MPEAETSRASGRESTAIYVYCFARAGAVSQLKAAGVDGRSGVRPLQVKDVAAVASEVSLAEFRGQCAESHMEDPAWVVPRACQHERVIEEVMGYSPVLPVRFGTLFSSRQALERLLADRHQHISRFLESIADKEEWAVKGFVDLKKTTEWVWTSDAALREERRHMPGSQGARYLREKQLRTQAHNHARRLCRSAARQIQEQLDEVAVDSRPLTLQTRSASGRDADMVVNRACLLHRGRVADFRTCVQTIGTRYAEQGFALELSGPWPPHNFCPSIDDELG